MTVHRHAESSLSNSVIFPITEQQRNGLEDLRLVRFDHGDGDYEWLGTYTAYSGHSIRSELLRTRDFASFKLEPIQGRAGRNKGMALFPEKIGGEYVMVGRQDGKNLYLIRSDRIDTWDSDGVLLMEPKYPWEFIQIGNCGSPIRTDAGWLLFTHGVGAMRKYALGCALLDLDDPSKVIAPQPKPVLTAIDADRSGYVPNVIYTCGALLVGERLLDPLWHLGQRGRLRDRVGRRYSGTDGMIGCVDGDDFMTEPIIHPVILCGGSGTRLWPRSRKAKPKPFLPLVGERTLFEATLAAALDEDRLRRPVVVTGAAHIAHVDEQAGGDAQVIVEPAARNTAAAIALAAALLPADAVMLVCPSDHHIGDSAGLRRRRARRRQAGARRLAGRVRHRRATGPRPASAISARASRSRRAGLRGRPVRREARPGDRRELPRRWRLCTGTAASSPSRAGRVPGRARAAPPGNRRRGAPGGRRRARGWAAVPSRRRGFAEIDSESVDYAVMENTTPRRDGPGRHGLVGHRQLAGAARCALGATRPATRPRAMPNWSIAAT